VALALSIGTGCWQKAEREMEDRVEGMEGHLIELFDAADAVRAADPKGYHKAMKALSKVEALPGVDDAGLDGVRTAAQAAEAVDDRGQQAQGVAAVAGACVSCHTQLGGDAPSLHGVEGDAATLALAAYIWRDDALWTRASEAARAEGAPWPTAEPPWGQRGALLTTLLAR
jgi:mono/diheme cytochrome c family protein